MKKNYFMLALASMMMAACANNDLVDVGVVKEEVPQAIGFETFAQKATRAENSEENYSQDLGDHHTSFEVYAYKNVSTTRVFDNETVEYTAATTGNDGSTIPAKWSYEGLVYWDKTASEYNFYAAAPAANYWTLNDKKDNSNKVIQDQSYFTITGHAITAHNATVANDHSYVDVFGSTATDLMIAATEQVNANSTQALFADVQLDFIHILSRLNITVSKHSDISDKIVTLNSLTVNNLYGKGDFDENSELETELSAGTTARWSVTDYSANKINYESLEEEELHEASSTTPAEYMLQSLVIPQTVAYEPIALDGTGIANATAPYICITYTIADGYTNDSGDFVTTSSEQFVAYYNLAAAFGLRPTTNNDGSVTPASPLAFNEGWQNTLNITLQPGAISFSANVATWDDNQTQSLPIN